MPNPTRHDLLSQAQKDCRLALETLPGIKILEYVLMYCGVYAINAEREAITMAMREGKRAVGLHLQELAGFAPVIKGGKDE